MDMNHSATLAQAADSQDRLRDVCHVELVFVEWLLPDLQP